MPYLKEGEEGEKEGRRDRALTSSQRQLPQRYHLQILKWSYERLIYTICWFGFIGQELLILGFWRTRIVDSTQIENQHSGRRMTFWKYTFPLCWSETTKWVTESTKWEYISTKWATETAKGVTETTKWESKKQQSGQRVLYRRYGWLPDDQIVGWLIFRSNAVTPRRQRIVYTRRGAQSFPGAILRQRVRCCRHHFSAQRPGFPPRCKRNKEFRLMLMITVVMVMRGCRLFFLPGSSGEIWY